MKIRICLMLGCAVCAALAAAQEPALPSNERDVIYIPAEPLKRSAPSYPRRALNQRREGWALASFIISEEGEVIEPMIEGSSHSDFDAPTLRAIENWRFKPATLGGAPVEQSMVQTLIRYKLADVTGARAQFVRKYREAYALLTASKLTEAAPLLQALEEGELNFYEDAWLGWLRYVYLEAGGAAEPEALMNTLRRALGSSETEDDDYLEPDVFVSASQRLYVLRVRGGDLSGAVTVFERLEASKTAQRSELYEEVLASLEPVQQAIMSLVGGDKVLQEVARIDEHNYWVHRLLRRSFALGDIQGGELELVDLRCTRANRRFAVTPDAVLKIPDTWGDCSVYIKGDKGTTFAFEEYPDNASAVEPAPNAPTRTSR